MSSKYHKSQKKKIEGTERLPVSANNLVRYSYQCMSSLDLLQYRAREAESDVSHVTA
jgi:hypothetical protein